MSVLAVVLLILIVMLVYGAYHWNISERLANGSVVSGDLCAQQFGVGEDLRVGLSNSSKFQRWYLSKDGTLSIQQGRVLPGGARFQVESMLTRRFSDVELDTLRKLFNSKNVKDIQNGIYRRDITHNDRVLCNPADYGWLWTYMTLDRCITVECRGRKPAMDAISDEIMRLSRSVPGYKPIRS